MKIEIPRLTFDVEVMGFEGIERVGLEDVGRALESATWKSAEMVKGIWIKMAGKMGVHDTGAYIRGIDAEGVIRPVSSNVNDPNAAYFSVALDVVNTAKHAMAVEEGHAAFHLPDKVDWARSGRVKMSKAGVPYIHVPFRHYTFAPSGESTKTALRSMMDEGLTKEARNLDRRLAMGAGFQRTVSGQFVAVDKYRWEGLKPEKRIHRDAAIGTPERRAMTHVAFGMTNPAWKTSKYEGMMKTGEKGHTKYLTIRTMTRDSPGWNIPAQAGKWVARTTSQIAEGSDEVKKMFEATFNKAILKAI